MSRKSKTFSLLTIIVLFSLILVPTVSAFDGREGGEVIIGADEVIEDDLYIGAETVIIDGVIKGDLLAGANIITINGTVEGDLYTGAQTVIINGTVDGDVLAFAQTVMVNGTVSDDFRSGAAAVQLGAEAKIGDDLLFGGASLESMPGSLVEGDLLFGGAQILAAGSVNGDLSVGTSAFTLKGDVGGNVKAYVDAGEANQNPGGPMYFGPEMEISIPSVKPGLTIDKAASIGGDLTYTATESMTFPAGVVAGETLRIEPTVTAEPNHPKPPAPPTPQHLAGLWLLKLLRTAITLTLIGLLLGWLFPNLLAGAEYKLQTEAMPSLGWGVLTYIFFFVAILVIITAMILGSVIFGMLTLGGLVGAILMLGFFALFTLVVGFILSVLYLTKIIVSVLGGKLILARVKPELVNHQVYPLVVGVVLLSIIITIPILGWLFKLLVVFFGLGALWLLGKDQFGKKAALAEG